MADLPETFFGRSVIIIHIPPPTSSTTKFHFMEMIRSTLNRLLTVGLLFAFSNMGLTQTLTVSGKVTDAIDGFGLPGVNILVTNGEGTTGTVSDIDGSYTLRVPKGAIVEFSFTGYSSQSFTIETDRTLDVALGTEEALLNEVVVVGYGAVKKDDLTGSVTKVGEEEFNRGVITSPEQLLVGKVSGLQISTDGAPGGKTRFRLRGETSLRGLQEPLVVIDGVPLDNKDNASARNIRNFINPDDIESMVILKDASATAIYGSRGASGVIVITTKKGKDKLSVNYKGTYSIARLGNTPDIFGSDQFRRAIDSKAPQLINDLGDADTDWVKEVTQNATGTQHNLSFSGAKNKFNYLASFNHRTNNGVLKTSKNQINTILVNLSTKALNDDLEISLRNKTAWVKNNFAPNVLQAALNFDPTQSVLDAESIYGGYFQWNDPLVTNNPVSTLDLTNEEAKSVRTINSLDLKYRIPGIEGVSLTAIGSYDYTDGEKFRVRDPLLKDGENFERMGNLRTEDERHISKLLETYLTYEKQIARSKINYVLGYSWQDFDRENKWIEADTIVAADNEYGFERMGQPELDSVVTYNRLISFFTRLNYNFDEKYLLTLSLRRDGSTRFGPSNRWGWFPAGAIAWRILQEDFAAGLNKTFTDLKLRIGYGITGNEGIGDYLYAIYYRYGQNDARYQFGDEYVAMLRGDGVDPNIKWESTTSFNIGLDFGILNNRLTGTLDWYQKKTVDLLFEVATAAFTNLSDRIFTNIGEMENSGVELGLQSYIIDRDALDWELSFTASYNINKITKLDNSVDNPDFQGYEEGGISGDVGQTIQRLKVGDPAYAFFTYQHKLDANGNPVADGNPIDLYVDVDGDGIINERDLVIQETPAPKFMFGLTSNTTYKNFDLAFTLRANLGNYVYNNVASSTGYFDRLSDRVPNNTSTSSFETNFKERQLKSDYYIENASFLKLDNISLGYSFKNIDFLRNLRIFATVQNLLTITGYSGLDPELPQFNNGIDNNIYPVSQTYLFGLSASF